MANVPARGSSNPRQSFRGLWLGLVALAVGFAPGLAQSVGEEQPLIPEMLSPRPGDLIRLTIWREPDLSGEFPVDTHGVVVLPRLGPTPVAGTPTDSLQARLVRAYEQYLNHASINIVILRRVQVLGAVRNPGLYQVDPTMSISDVLAVAGGATPHGNIRGVELIRDGRTVARHLSPLAPIGHTALRSGDQLFVPERSWLSRNPAVLVASFSAALSFALSLLR